MDDVMWEIHIIYQLLLIYETHRGWVSPALEC